MGVKKRMNRTKNTKKAENLAAVHTHTHTHTCNLRNNKTLINKVLLIIYRIIKIGVLCL